MQDGVNSPGVNSSRSCSIVVCTRYLKTGPNNRVLGWVDLPCNNYRQHIEAGARSGCDRFASTLPPAKPGGNHLSNTACLTQVFFKTSKQCGKMRSLTV